MSLHLEKTIIYSQIFQGHRQVGKKQGGIAVTFISQESGHLLRELAPVPLILPALTAVVDHGV